MAVKSNEAPRQTPGSQARLLRKICGGDIELANFVWGSDPDHTTCRRASRALLREVDGVARETLAAAAGSERSISPSDDFYGRSASGWDEQDWGRTWLATNGGCVYIDLDHIELCLPECSSAWEHTAAWHAMLRLSRSMLDRANARMPPGERIVVLVNCSDGQSNAFGAHQNYTIAQQTWSHLFERRLHYMLFLASHQVSSIILTSQGKVGSENGRPPVPYQVACRADFLECLAATRTTYARPICNTRREFHTGPHSPYWRDLPRSRQPARLHCIMYDSVLCHAANLLRTGMMQICLAMLEAQFVNPALIVDDPVAAVVAWSHDPTLRTRMRMASGKRFSAVELQMGFLEEALRFSVRFDLDEVVPGADRILALWEDSLNKLRARDFHSLVSRLDWLLKKHILEEAMDCDRRLSWDSPQIKYLDHLYASLDREEGLYWQYESAGLVERRVAEADIARLVVSPPEKTRAWSRAMLLRRFGSHGVRSVDWDSICLRSSEGNGWGEIALELPDPAGFTRAQVQPILDRFGSAEELRSKLKGLRAPRLTARTK
jgi:proteasome accessory factor A